MLKPIILVIATLTLAQTEPANPQGNDPSKRNWPGEKQSNPFDQFDAEGPWGDDEPESSWSNEFGDWFWIYERDTKRRDGTVTFWLNEKYAEAKPGGVIRALSRITYDCDERLKYTAQTTYKADNTVYRSFDQEARLHRFPTHL